MENKIFGYNIYYRGKNNEQKHQFCSDQKSAIELSERLSGNYISFVWQRSPKYFLQHNKAKWKKS